MGTTQKTQQSNQFDPTAMSQYQGLQGGLGDMLKGYMNNPFGNPFFQTQQQLGTRQAQNLGGTQMNNLLHNMTSSGMLGGVSSPAGLEMQQNQARANTGLQSQLGFLQPVMNALGMQQWAGGMAENYRPLQTGQSQTQSTSGLGTWLPQVANMALGAATGGASNMFGGLFRGGGASSPWSMSTPGASGFDYGGAFTPRGGWSGANAGGPSFGSGVGGGPTGNLGIGPMAPPPPPGAPGAAGVGGPGNWSG